MVVGCALQNCDWRRIFHTRVIYRFGRSLLRCRAAGHLEWDRSFGRKGRFGRTVRDSQSSPHWEWGGPFADFEKALRRILGTLFTAVSCALARSPEVKLDSMPRMADFALWAVAAAPALGFTPEEFLAAYGGNRAEAVQETLAGDVVATAITALMESASTDETGAWQGTCKELLTKLGQFVDDDAKKSRDWPKSPRGLSGRLRRLVTFLTECGTEIRFSPKGTEGNGL